MKRQLFCSLLLSGAVTAAPSSFTLDGDRFVSMVSRSAAMPMDPADYLQREKAYSYLDGVRDSAEGRVWCDVHQLKTPDLAYELSAEIARMPEAERRKSAAQLLLDLLRQKFPCRPEGVRP